ncbi:sulfotransferase [Waterburya agarophytonicola K14]|uniref:Sulfotransferase n=1 Tax=Waterburya agarophytonicola KI4 TaxID=2874699 RepID=A0A964BQF5_9CYAN|nr:sulfotransferase [Waterburya agarophytonicola]MCC0176447.1 sulfotransferase [Waterburya agarophytonicola KI4]
MVAQIDNLYIKTSLSKTLSRLISYGFFEGRPLTTKGQWINPLIFRLFAISQKLPQLKKVEKPIFVIGTGRSGTTILGVVLSMHQQVGFLNEPKAIWHTIYPYEDLIGSYSQGKAEYRLDAADVNDSTIHTANRIFGTYLKTIGASRLVDKYPELVFRVPFVREIFPDAKFIFLVRNGWDTCQSIDSWSKRLGTNVKEDTHDWWGVNNRKWHLLIDRVAATNPDFQENLATINAYCDHTAMAAVEWILTMQEGLKLVEQFPDDVYLLKYEDLVSQPKNSLEKLLNFCELPADDKMFAYANKTLSSRQNYQVFPLPSEITPIFIKTMTQLGYES